MVGITAATTVFAVIAAFLLVMKAVQVLGSMAHYGAYRTTTSFWVETFVELFVISFWINLLLFGK